MEDFRKIIKRFKDRESLSLIEKNNNELGILCRQQNIFNVIRDFILVFYLFSFIFVGYTPFDTGNILNAVFTMNESFLKENMFDLGMSVFIFMVFVFLVDVFLKILPELRKLKYLTLEDKQYLSNFHLQYEIHFDKATNDYRKILIDFNTKYKNTEDINSIKDFLNKEDLDIFNYLEESVREMTVNINK